MSENRQIRGLSWKVQRERAPKEIYVGGNEHDEGLSLVLGAQMPCGFLREVQPSAHGLAIATSMPRPIPLGEKGVVGLVRAPKQSTQGSCRCLCAALG